MYRARCYYLSLLVYSVLLAFCHLERAKIVVAVALPARATKTILKLLLALQVATTTFLRHSLCWTSSLAPLRSKSETSNVKLTVNFNSTSFSLFIQLFSYPAGRLVVVGQVGNSSKVEPQLRVQHNYLLVVTQAKLYLILFYFIALFPTFLGHTF